MAAKLFFALYPTPEAARRFHAFGLRLRALHHLNAWPVAADRLHVTLVYLGRDDQIGEAELAEILRAAGAVRMRPFRVGFDRYLSFRNGGALPLVMKGGDGVPCVYALHDALDAALVNAGLARRRPAEFTPHLTLLRDETVVAEALCDPISWWVDSFALVSSQIGVARHDVLGRWSLNTIATG